MSGLTHTPDGKVTDLLANYEVPGYVLAGCVRLLEREGALDVLPMLTEGIRS